MRRAQGELRDVAEVRRRAQAFAFMSAPADTHRMPLLLAVSTGARFRSTSSRAQSRPRRSTSPAKGSASRPPSSSRAASRRMACSRSSSAPPAQGAFAFMSAPADTHALMLSHHHRPTPGSLALNQLCGVDLNGYGTYTTEGITKLCEALKRSAVTSLKCAAAPQKRSLLCQRPLTLMLALSRTHARSLSPADDLAFSRTHARSPSQLCSSHPVSSGTGSETRVP